jgi:hypothetical protein
MIHMTHRCVSDRASLMLFAALIASLSLALLGARADTPSIPDHLLDRIRGAYPEAQQNPAGSCTTINVIEANYSGGGPYVNGFSDCTVANSACITCKAGVSGYSLGARKSPIIPTIVFQGYPAG